MKANSKYLRFTSVIRFATVLMTAIASQVAHAGFVEIGASGSYRLSNIDKDAYDESSSLTASLGYYFSESSSIDLSYTDGRSTRAISKNSPNGHVTSLYYKTLGLDFVYTFGTKDSPVRPYIKAGTNYIMSKRIVDQYRRADGEWERPFDEQVTPGLVPSAGIGVRVGVTDNLSLKLGLDGWTSGPLNTSSIGIDWFGRAGLSFLF